MRIWLVDIFEPLPWEGFPPGRYAHLHAELQRRGHEVLRISADFFHALKSRRPTPPPGSETRLLHAPAYRTNVSSRRVLSHVAVALQGARVFASERPAPDLIVACWGPVELAAACVRHGRRVGAVVCLDVLDTWPDSFARVLPGPLAPLAGALLLPHRRLARWTLRRCDGLTGISQTYIDWARSRRGTGGGGLPSAVFWPSSPTRRGIAGDVDRARVPGGRSRPLRCVFAGTFGAMYDLELILDGAGALQRRRPGAVTFDLAGDGPRFAAIVRRYRGLPNVRFHGRLRRPALERLVADADVGFCCYPPGAPQTLTTTFFYYLSYGLAVIATPQAEMAALVEDHGMGEVVADRAAMVAALSRLADDRPRLLARRRAALDFGRAHGVERVSAEMADFLEGIAARRRASR